jgi:hypothetical protein
MVHVVLLAYCCRDADHTPPSSAEVKKELSYTSTHPMGPPGPVTGFPLPSLSYCCTVVHIDILYNTVLCTQYLLILCVYHTVFVIMPSDCHNICSASCRSFDANSGPI